MPTTVKTGIDILQEEGFGRFSKKGVGLIINPSSVNRNLESTLEIFLKNNVKVTSLFGPEHGILGELQDQERYVVSKNNKIGLPVYSLYGNQLAPTKKMLKNVDILVFDIQDVGARYYTFIWTMALAMKKTAQYKKRFIVLDRPNPINGLAVEGPVLKKGYETFIGLYPIPVRHGMTAAELALMFNKEFNINTDLEIVTMQGWKRNQWFDKTGLTWVSPSPNMSTLDTAMVYPGMCLLEGTNVSEGRGTTKPFEYFGAPWLEQKLVLKELQQLTGCKLRPLYFKPLWNKYKGEICKGFQLHITDRNKFKPIITTLKIILAIKKTHPDKFTWKKPPYEFEEKFLPFDILIGNPDIRKLIDDQASIKDIKKIYNSGLDAFKKIREKYLQYD